MKFVTLSRCLGAIAALSLACHAGAAEAPSFSRTEQKIPAAGSSMTVELYTPTASGKHPAVVVLHGADGLTIESFRRYYRHYLEALANAGYVVLFPHYMETTGDKGANELAIIAHFADWTKAATETVDYATTLKSVDPARLGIAGASLGASLALNEAAHDTRPKAVVEMFGALPDFVLSTIQRLPPVLILHGDKDWLVNVREAYRLEAFMKEKRIPYEMKIYPGASHGFAGATNADATARMLDFLGRHLAFKI